MTDPKNEPTSSHDLALQRMNDWEEPVEWVDDQTQPQDSAGKKLAAGRDAAAADETRHSPPQ